MADMAVISPHSQKEPRSDLRVTDVKTVDVEFRALAPPPIYFSLGRSQSEESQFACPSQEKRLLKQLAKLCRQRPYHTGSPITVFCPD
ncbi:MAG: hypothetical protein KDA80_10875 [Planctomycetaceae bacterium]|nr:hypothetical protein [Planctomycetaceae bacterium]